MRLFWVGFLTVGLLAVGLSVYESSSAGSAGPSTGVTASMAEDGTGIPSPNPTPPPRP